MRGMERVVNEESFMRQSVHNACPFSFIRYYNCALCL